MAPKVNSMMSRERPQVNWEPDPTATPTPVPENPQTTAQTGEYYFPESDSRYLTDEEISVYSSADLELAKERNLCPPWKKVCDREDCRLF